MARIPLGLICGVAFGTLAVLMMLPLSFPDKRTALTAAFLDRFAIGFVIAVADVPGPAWLVGMGFGLMLSAPSALITKAWRPIIGIGALGGGLIGVVVSHSIR
jgi:hypothetical protein